MDRHQIKGIMISILFIVFGALIGIDLGRFFVIGLILLFIVGIISYAVLGVGRKWSKKPDRQP